jgi:hypothetical protein
MAKCEVCGNQRDEAFELIAGGRKHVVASERNALRLTRTASP